MNRLTKTLIPLTLVLAISWALSDPAAARGYGNLRYQKNATAYNVQQANKLRNRVGQDMARQNLRWQNRPQKPSAKVVKPAVKLSPEIKDSTTRAYISRSLHKQAGLNYYLKDQKVRVTNLQLDSNKFSYGAGGKRVGWTAKIQLPGGDSYTAKGFVRQARAGQPKGLQRVNITSGTPVFSILSR